MNRRDVLKLLAVGAAGYTLSHAAQRRAHGAATAHSTPEPTMETYTYKTAGDCRIKADVYRAGTRGTKRPVIVTIHGGALIMGGYQISRGLRHRQ